MNDTLNSLLDSNLDDLADLPEFGVFPAGVHKVTVAFEEKTVNAHPSIEFKFKLIETIEMSNPADEPLAAGAEGSVLFMMDNEFGQGKFKALIKWFAVELGLTNLREVVEGAKGMEVTLVTKVRQNKDKTQSYTDVVKVM